MARLLIVRVYLPYFDRHADEFASGDRIDVPAPPRTGNVNCDRLNPVVDHNDGVGPISSMVVSFGLIVTLS